MVDADDLPQPRPRYRIVMSRVGNYYPQKRERFLLFFWRWRFYENRLGSRESFMQAFDAEVFIGAQQINDKQDALPKWRVHKVFGP